MPNKTDIIPDSAAEAEAPDMLEIVEALDAKIDAQASAFSEAVGAATTAASTAALALLQPKLDALTAKVNAVAGAKTSVMAISFDGSPKRKLTHEAHEELPRILRRVHAGINILLVGPAGAGKTTLAGQIAEALDRPFGTINFTSGASETWLMGRHLPNGFLPADFCEKYEQGGVFLGDEFDAVDSNMALALNNALANGSFYNPQSGKTIHKHKDFVFIAAANTFGRGANATYTGRNRLDGATLNRFACGVLYVDYNETLEAEICGLPRPDKPPKRIFGATTPQNVHKALTGLRAALVKAGSGEIISTRHFINGAALAQRGESLSDIVQSATYGWSPDLLKTTGAETIIKEGKV